MKREFAIMISLAASAVSFAQNTAPADSLSNLYDDQLLDEIEIVAQKPIVKMTTDKITYDVSQDSEAKALTILDMLRKVPMVNVDGQDNITVNGSSQFKIYVDGKPNVMFSSNPSQILKAMPASLVKNIEVITNPGAKYDAEGSGGVLNFTLNHQTMSAMTGGGASESINGFNGNIRLSGGNKGYGAGAFLSGQHNRFTFSANANLNKQIMNGTEVLMEQQQLGANPSTSTILQHDGKTSIPFQMANISMGYELDSMSTVNATIGYNAFTMKNSGITDNTMTGGIYGSGFGYAMTNDLQNKHNSVNVSADYQRFLNKDRSSSVILSYYFSQNPTLTENASIYDHSASLPAGFDTFLTDRFSSKDEHSREHTLQLDYTTPLAKNHVLNAGAKYTSHMSNALSELFYGNETLVLQPDLSSEYRNTKSILATYAEHEGKYGNFSSRAGLRYEHTWQSVEYAKGNGGDFSNDYGNIVPTLSLSYSPVMFANVGMTYSMRISRPGISYLNPYVDRTVNTALTYGNPDLDVEKTHNIGMVVNFFTPAIMCNLNLRYALTDNAIEQYSFMKDNLLNTTYGNIMKRETTSASLFASALLHKNTRIIANASANYNSLHSDVLDKSHRGWQYNMMLGAQQTLPLNMKLGAYLINNSKTYTLQGRTSGFNMITATLNRSFMKDKLNVALQALTGLSSGGRLHLDTTNSSNDFVSTTNISVPLRSVTLSLTYNFGNSNVKVRTHESKVKSDIIEQRSSMEQIGEQMGQQ